jgi:hypothetical protein
LHDIVAIGRPVSHSTPLHRILDHIAAYVAKRRVGRDAATGYE